MSRKLEEFVRANLDCFDEVEAPDVDLFWLSFKQNKAASGWASAWWKLAIAASVAVIIGVMCTWIISNRDANIMTVSNLHRIDPNLAEYHKSLNVSIANYNRLIETIRIDPETLEEFNSKLNEVESITQKYQIDLETYGPDPNVIKSLLKCSKQKVRLYEILLYEIQLKTYHEKQIQSVQI